MEYPYDAPAGKRIHCCHEKKGDDCQCIVCDAYRIGAGMTLEQSNRRIIKAFLWIDVDGDKRLFQTVVFDKSPPTFHFIPLRTALGVGPAATSLAFAAAGQDQPRCPKMRFELMNVKLLNAKGTLGEANYEYSGVEDC